MRVGFICDDRFPSLGRVLRGQCGVRELVTGCRSATSLGIMRVGWIAQAVNTQKAGIMRYEWYRPGRRYDVIIYVKSMSDPCRKHARAARENGVITVFDANVDYFSDTVADTFYYDGMAPTAQQRAQAVEMCEICDGVIADSPHILSVSKGYAKKAAWISDNVRDDLVISPKNAPASGGGKLNIFWSGQAVKLFELLLVGDVLKEFRDRIRLVLITNALDALEKWQPNQKSRFEELLGDIEHEIIPFASVEGLVKIYDAGGVCMAPRHMNNAYNRGHTEWKITLAMARGVPALASPLASYCKVFERSRGKGIRLCASQDDWRDMLSEVLGAAWNHKDEGAAAVSAVNEYYKTSILAAVHSDFVSNLVEGES